MYCCISSVSRTPVLTFNLTSDLQAITHPLKRFFLCDDGHACAAAFMVVVLKVLIGRRMSIMSSVLLPLLGIFGAYGVLGFFLSEVSGVSAV